MSERFVLHAPEPEIESYFGVKTESGHTINPNYNISPGTLHPLVIENENQREIKQAKWGLIPPDAKDERAGKDSYSAPLEELDDGEIFTECIEQRRALVPASGFYKWKSTENKTTPFYVRMLSDELTALAGIYSIWESTSGRKVYSFAILTTKSNALVEPIDERMPVIVRSEQFERWLNEKNKPSEILEEIAEGPTLLTEMIVNRVSEEVNDISNNSPQLIQPIPK